MFVVLKVSLVASVEDLTSTEDTDVLIVEAVPVSVDGGVVTLEQRRLVSRALHVAEVYDSNTTSKWCTPEAYRCCNILLSLY